MTFMSVHKWIIASVQRQSVSNNSVDRVLVITGSTVVFFHQHGLVKLKHLGASSVKQTKYRKQMSASTMKVNLLLFSV